VCYRFWLRELYRARSNVPVVDVINAIAPKILATTYVRFLGVLVAKLDRLYSSNVSFVCRFRRRKVRAENVGVECDDGRNDWFEF
jgi:hypothetical protein